MSDLIQPHDEGSERNVLGALLRDPDAISRVAEILLPDMFYVPVHRQIFQSCLNLYNIGQPIDLRTLWTEFQKIDGHYPYEPADLAALSSTVPTSANIEFYANTVKDKYQIRCVQNVSSDLFAKGFRPDTTASEMIERAESGIFAIADRQKGSALTHISAVAKQAYERLQLASNRDGHVAGLATGYRDLDHLTGGFSPGELTLLAARPGMGKTSFGLNVSENVSHRGGGVVVFSLEMSELQLVMRMISSVGKIDSFKLRDGFVGMPDWEKLAETVGVLGGQPIWFDESTRYTVASIRSKMRRAMIRNSGIKLVVVDYIQMLAANYKKMDQYQAVTEISRELKAMAREFDIPVLACCQLNRRVEERRGEQARPQLSDLRDSGALEQDADVVLFLWREGEEAIDHNQPMKLIVAKNRNGPTGTVDLIFRRNFTRFESTSTREFDN